MWIYCLVLLSISDLENIDNNCENSLKKYGFYIQRKYFDEKYLGKINEVCNKILKLDAY